MNKETQTIVNIITNLHKNILSGRNQAGVGEALFLAPVRILKYFSTEIHLMQIFFEKNYCSLFCAANHLTASDLSFFSCAFNSSREENLRSFLRNLQNDASRI